MAKTVQQPERSSEKLGMAVAIPLIVLAVYGVAQSRGVALGASLDWNDVGRNRLHDLAEGPENARRAPRWMQLDHTWRWR